MENKEYADFINDNKIVKSSVNGLYRIVVLWIIKHYECIHGYSIMKELDKFFINLVNEKAVKKSSPSKIYPILNEMEEGGLIKGYWEMHENKKIKFYRITQKGEFLIDYLFDRLILFEKNPQWKLMYDDLVRKK